MVVDADERSSEGEYLAEGDEYGVVYLADRWAEEARYEQCAPEDAERNRDCELKFSHIHSKKLCALRAGCVAVRGWVLLSQEVVRLRRVGCAPRRLCRLCRGYCCVAAITSRRDTTHAQRASLRS